MKKKIYATGNETIKGEFNVSYYIFEKDESFLEWLGKLLVEVLGIERGEEQAKFIIGIAGDGEEIFNEKNLDKMIDIHEKYEKKGDRVDVFYGKNRVYVTLRKSREIRKKFADFVKKTRRWIEQKEIRNRPSQQVFSNKR